MSACYLLHSLLLRHYFFLIFLVAYIESWLQSQRDITHILTGAFDLTGFEVFKAHSTEECLNKVNELDGKVDIVFVNGKIAANTGAMLIIKVKRINSNIKMMVLAEDETDRGFRIWY
jgi:hypothetical protein